MSVHFFSLTSILAACAHEANDVRALRDLLTLSQLIANEENQ